MVALEALGAFAAWYTAGFATAIVAILCEQHYIDGYDLKETFKFAWLGPVLWVLILAAWVSTTISGIPDSKRFLDFTKKEPRK